MSNYIDFWELIMQACSEITRQPRLQLIALFMSWIIPTQLFSQTVPDLQSIANQGSIISSPSIQITPPLTKEQSWTKKATSGINQRDSSVVFEDKEFLKKIRHQFSQALVTHDKEIGFLSHREDSVLIPSHIRRMQAEYIINFDGNGLIYYPLSRIVHAAKNAPHAVSTTYRKKKSLFHKEHEILLSKSVKNVIMEQVINSAGVVQANHLSIRGDHLILDTQDPQSDRLRAQEKDYLDLALQAIQQKSRSQVSKTAPRIEWRPRKTKTGV